MSCARAKCHLAIVDFLTANGAVIDDNIDENENDDDDDDDDDDEI
jgi:hypothetical protein